MKKGNQKGKLLLKKTTIAILNNGEMMHLRGGSDPTDPDRTLATRNGNISCQCDDDPPPKPTTLNPDGPNTDMTMPAG